MAKNRFNLLIIITILTVVVYGILKSRKEEIKYDPRSYNDSLTTVVKIRVQKKMGNLCDSISFKAYNIYQNKKMTYFSGSFYLKQNLMSNDSLFKAVDHSCLFLLAELNNYKPFDADLNYKYSEGDNSVLKQIHTNYVPKK